MATTDHPHDTYDSEILEGMAQAAYSCLWADREEEAGRSLSQVNVYTAAPPAPRWARRWAQRQARLACELNGVSSLTALFVLAQALYGFVHTAEHFGSDLAMEITGTGVAWHDDCGPEASDAFALPRAEFYQGAV